MHHEVVRKSRDEQVPVRWEPLSSGCLVPAAGVLIKALPRYRSVLIVPSVIDSLFGAVHGCWVSNVNVTSRTFFSQRPAMELG